MVLDQNVVEDVGDALCDLVDVGGHALVVVDLRGVHRLTSAMVAKLIRLHKKAVGKGGRLVLCNLAPPIVELMKSLRLTQLFHIYGSEQEALQSF
jgi:anti-anti-sigma factor